MVHASIPLLSHYLRRLTVRNGDAATDHELLQRFLVRREEAAFAASALKTMLMSKFKYALTLLLMLGVLGAGMGLAALRETTTPKHEPEASATAAAPKHEPEALATEEPLPAGAVACLAC